MSNESIDPRLGYSNCEFVNSRQSIEGFPQHGWANKVVNEHIYLRLGTLLIPFDNSPLKEAIPRMEQNVPVSHS